VKLIPLFALLLAGLSAQAQHKQAESSAANNDKVQGVTTAAVLISFYLGEPLNRIAAKRRYKSARASMTVQEAVNKDALKLAGGHTPCHNDGYFHGLRCRIYV